MALGKGKSIKTQVDFSVAHAVVIDKHVMYKVYEDEYNLGDAELIPIYAAIMGVTARAAADLKATRKPTPSATP